MTKKTGTEDKAQLVAFVGVPIEFLTYREWDSNEIRVTIGTLNQTEVNGAVRSFPVNWRHGYDESKKSTGGCFARIFAGKAWTDSPSKGLFGYYGPEISYGTAGEYEHGARAMRRIEKALESFRQTRGESIDAADCMGRFLEACGMAEIWVAQDRHSNLGSIDWRVMSLGSFVHTVRYHLPETVRPVQASA